MFMNNVGCRKSFSRAVVGGPSFLTAKRRISIAHRRAVIPDGRRKKSNCTLVNH